MSGSLPPGFEALEPYVSEWALARADERARKRRASTEAERTAFFEAGKRLLADALEYLDAKPFAEHDEKDSRLMDLLLGFAHVALAVEQQGEDEPKLAQSSRHFTITRTPAIADVQPS